MMLSFAAADTKIIATLWDEPGGKVLLVAQLPVGSTITDITYNSISWIEEPWGKIVTPKMEWSVKVECKGGAYQRLTCQSAL